MEKNVKQVSPFPVGEKNEAYARYFTGQSYLAPLTTNAALNCPVSNVTFEPGCRNNWHSHTQGQILIVVGGVGCYQEKDRPARRLLPGDVVEIAPNVVHWHGATPDSWFTHLSITPNPQQNLSTWLSPVTDEEYTAATACNQSFAPLSEKQEAMALIAASTALVDIPCLKMAVNAGLDAGLTLNEIREIAVQLYAYCGFPRALNALNAIAEVAGERAATGRQVLPGKTCTAIPVAKSSYELGSANQHALFGIAQGPLTRDASSEQIIHYYLRAHLFGDIFARDVLDWKTREFVTVAALSVMSGCEAQLHSHLGAAERQGNSREELEALMAFAQSRMNMNL
ncbi:MAG: carboxymuconolactone decarboxylase family protein [Mediterranea sp.]|jgi:AhpD family alkylhydroperoxidase|nr:carboxymuconolactone decarboxylase family protein [Mediterranea sp.]